MTPPLFFWFTVKAVYPSPQIRRYGRATTGKTRNPWITQGRERATDRSHLLKGTEFFPPPPFRFAVEVYASRSQFSIEILKREQEQALKPNQNGGDIDKCKRCHRRYVDRPEREGFRDPPPETHYYRSGNKSSVMSVTCNPGLHKRGHWRLRISPSHTSYI